MALPDFQYPDILGNYLRGIQAPQQLQAQQQENTLRGLSIEQQRLAFANQQAMLPFQQSILRAAIQQIGGGQRDAGSPDNPQNQPQATLGGRGGGIQNGPQDQVSHGAPPAPASSYDGSQPATGLNWTDPVGPQTVSPQLLAAMATSPGPMAEMAKGLSATNEAAMKAAQFKAQGPLDLIDSIYSNPQPARVVDANPGLKQRWQQIAPQLGLDPTYDFSDDNVRRALAFAGNQIRGTTGQPAKAYSHYTDVVGPNGAFGQREDATNKLTMDSRAPMLDEYRFAQSQGYPGKFTDFLQLKSQSAEAKPPSGYKWNPDGTLEVIKGGPADKSGLDSRSGLMFQRVLSSANEATAALKNIAELPVGASTGVLGVGAAPGHSVMDSIKGNLTNKLASQDVQDYNSMIAGVSRSLSTIESAGLAPNGMLTHSMDAVTLRDGDTELTKLRKLAEARQIIVKGIETNLDNPKLPQQQRDAVQRIIDEVQTAIPFTHHDLTELQRKQQANPSTTLNDVIRRRGLNKSQSAEHPPEIQAILDQYPQKPR